VLDVEDEEREQERPQMKGSKGRGDFDDIGTT
jgi:hypothetical protein